MSSSELIVTFGALAPFMADSEIEEIWINSPERIFVARKGKNELTNLFLTTSEVQNIVERALMWSGRRLDLSHPFVDARLRDGSRLHVAIPEITSEHWAVNIRKHLMQNLSLTGLVDSTALTREMARTLNLAVCGGLNILVSGGTQSGKTTLLNALISEVPVHERVITIEEVFELKPKLPDVISLQTRSPNLQGEGAIALRGLIKESLRMRPSRIVVGEVRAAEALDLLIALNSGLPGMGTIHANSARDAIVKLQTLPLLAGENISQRFISPIVASAIDLVVQVSLNSAGERRVVEIVAVTGRIENQHIEMETIWQWDGYEFQRGLGAIPPPRRFGPPFSIPPVIASREY